MKKIALPVWLLFTSSFYLKAQSNRPLNPVKDKIEFHGYTVRLRPAIGGTYGYDIFKGKALVLHQSYNPFTMAPIGLRKKNDVYKVAKWQIIHMNGQNKFPLTNNIANGGSMHGLQAVGMHKPVIINQPLPKTLAKELQIAIH